MRRSSPLLRSLSSSSRQHTPQRSFALGLYRTILKQHRRALPAEMRKLGDAYASEEWHRHKAASAEHLQPFFREWVRYLEVLSAAPAHDSEAVESAPLGAALTEEELAAMSAEQRQQLAKLKAEAQRFAAERDAETDEAAAADTILRPEGDRSVNGDRDRVLGP